MKRKERVSNVNNAILECPSKTSAGRQALVLRLTIPAE